VARPQTVHEGELLGRLAAVFRDVGYEGASLALLSDAAGLKKASLYHRFPGGKAQMAEEVLAAATQWAGERVLAALNGPGDPRQRLKQVIRELDAFYQGGRKACLLNMLAAPSVPDGPFAPAIKDALEAFVDGFAKLARDAGVTARVARRRGQRVVMLLQGALVLARGMGSPAPFRDFLDDLPAVLFEEGAR
jgi:AcrR family transcriptional regulator